MWNVFKKVKIEDMISIRETDTSPNKGDTVYVCNYGQGETWLPGTISEETGPVSCMVDFAYMVNGLNVIRIRFKIGSTYQRFHSCLSQLKWLQVLKKLPTFSLLTKN